MGTSLRLASYEAELGGDVSSMMCEYALDAPHVFPGHAPLARHLIASLMDGGFDVGAMNGVPKGRGGAGIGHAFGIMERKRVMSPTEIRASAPMAASASALFSSAARLRPTMSTRARARAKATLGARRIPPPPHRTTAVPAARTPTPAPRGGD